VLLEAVLNQELPNTERLEAQRLAFNKKAFAGYDEKTQQSQQFPIPHNHKNARIVFVQGLGMSALSIVDTLLVFARTSLTTLQKQNHRVPKLVGQVMC
jgi:hypothetical protein